ncbi:MAG: DUF4175 family protein, partial [Pseudomonadota bacterium]
MAEHRPRPTYDFVTEARRSLARRLRLTRLSIAAERGAAAFWPLWSVVFAFVALSLFGVFEMLPRAVHLGALAAFALGAAAALILGLRRFRWPGAADARDRLDGALPGRPLASLEDDIAAGAKDPAARAVWVAHLRRMAAAAEGAEAARPNLRLARRDPLALRLVAATALLAALLFARDDGLGALEAALDPGAAPEEAVVAATFEAWASPPAYTGRPVIYLSEVATGTALSVPEGTEITLRIYGDGEGTVTLDETVSGGAAALLDTAEGIRDASFPVEGPGRSRSTTPTPQWSRGASRSRATRPPPSRRPERSRRR